MYDSAILSHKHPSIRKNVNTTSSWSTEKTLGRINKKHTCESYKYRVIRVDVLSIRLWPSSISESYTKIYKIITIMKTTLALLLVVATIVAGQVNIYFYFATHKDILTRSNQSKNSNRTSSRASNRSRTNVRSPIMCPAIR